MSRRPLLRVYFIYQQNFPDKKIGLKALNNQTKIFNRLCEKYHNSFSVILILSNVNGEVAERYNIREGQVGAPKLEFCRKSGTRKDLFVNFHIHIVVVGEYAATAAEEFRDLMNKNFWKKNPDARMHGNPFTAEPAKGDGLYSKKYFMNQYRYIRYVGDKERLDLFDRANPNAIQLFPKKEDELNLPSELQIDQKGRVSAGFSEKKNYTLYYKYRNKRRKEYV